MPLDVATLNEGIRNQISTYDYRADIAGAITGISGSLLVGGAVLTVFIVVGIKMNPRWRSVNQVWCERDQTYHTNTFNPGYLLAGLGGPFGGIAASFVSGPIIGVITWAAVAVFGRLRLPLCDPKAGDQQLSASLRDLAPRLSDQHLQPMIDNADYHDLVRLEKLIGPQRLTRLISNAQLDDRTRWAWDLATGARSQKTLDALHHFLEDHIDQLTEARLHAPGFLSHLTRFSLERSQQLDAIPEDDERTRRALRSLAFRSYAPEKEGSSEVEIALGPSQTLTVNTRLINRHSPPIADWATLSGDQEPLIDSSEEQADRKEGLTLLLQVLQGERLIEELAWEEVRSKVYPAADFFGFEEMITRLDHVIKDKFDSGEISIEDLAGLNLSASLERHCVEETARKLPQSTNVKNTKKLLHIASCTSSFGLQDAIYALVMEQITKRNVVEWLERIDHIDQDQAHSNLKQRLTHFAISALREDDPESLQLLLSLWKYASQKNDPDLKEACLQLIRNSRQDVGVLLRRSFNGLIPSELYAALTRNPGYSR